MPRTTLLHPLLPALLVLAPSIRPSVLSFGTRPLSLPTLNTCTQDKQREARSGTRAGGPFGLSIAWRIELHSNSNSSQSTWIPWLDGLRCQVTNRSFGRVECAGVGTGGFSPPFRRVMIKPFIGRPQFSVDVETPPALPVRLLVHVRSCEEPIHMSLIKTQS